MPTFNFTTTKPVQFKDLAAAILEEVAPDRTPDKPRLDYLAGQLKAHTSWITRRGSCTLQVSIPQTTLGAMRSPPRLTRSLSAPHDLLSLRSRSPERRSSDHYQAHINVLLSPGNKESTRLQKVQSPVDGDCYAYSIAVGAMAEDPTADHLINVLAHRHGFSSLIGNKLAILKLSSKDRDSFQESVLKDFRAATAAHIKENPEPYMAQLLGAEKVTHQRAADFTRLSSPDFALAYQYKSPVATSYVRCVGLKQAMLQSLGVPGRGDRSDLTKLRNPDYEAGLCSLTGPAFSRAWNLTEALALKNKVLRILQCPGDLHPHQTKTAAVDAISLIGEDFNRALTITSSPEDFARAKGTLTTLARRYRWGSTPVQIETYNRVDFIPLTFTETAAGGAFLVLNEETVYQMSSACAEERVAFAREHRATIEGCADRISVPGQWIGPGAIRAMADLLDKEIIEVNTDLDPARASFIGPRTLRADPHPIVVSASPVHGQTVFLFDE